MRREEEECLFCWLADVGGAGKVNWNFVVVGVWEVCVGRSRDIDGDRSSHEGSGRRKVFGNLFQM